MKITLNKNRKIAGFAGISITSAGIVGTLATAAVTAASLAVAGFQIYSAVNPPKSPKQATSQLTAQQNQVAKLQAQYAKASAAGKNVVPIQTKITKLQSSISYLNTYLAQNATSGTPLASPAPGGLASSGAGTVVAVAVALAAVGGGIYFVTKKK